MTNQTLLRQVAAQGAIISDRTQLERFDWLSSALSIFISEGIDAVRITRLAENLGVTRGSFYWHFSNRNDLIDSLVEYWKNKNTPAILNSIDDPSSLDDGILSFALAVLVSSVQS